MFNKKRFNNNKIFHSSLFYYCCLHFVLLSPETNAAFTFDPSLTWKTLHTEHFNIHFHDNEESLAKQTAEIAERVHKRLSTYFIWIPLKPTDIVLTDRTDITNGGAAPFPNNQMTLFVSPPDDLNTVEDYNNWLEILIIHEYTHILHLDKTSNALQNIRNVFGRLFPWLFPNVLQPLWGIEGLATYMETDEEIGVGRGQSSLFKSLMRTEFDNGLKPIRQVNQPISSWPSGTTRYLYGVYFFQFIRDRYGEFKVRQLIDEHSRHFIPYMVNTTTNRVLGKDLDKLWEEFETYLQEKFGDQIEKIKAEGIHAGNQITFTNYQTIHPRVTPNGDVYYYQNDTQSDAKIMLLRNGSTKPIVVAEKIHTGRFDVHPDAGILVSQLETLRNVNIFSDLYQIDLSTFKITRLTIGGRYKFATWSPNGKQIIAVHNNLGNSSLVLLTNTGKKIDTLWRGANHEVISSIDWSPDGTSIVASVWRSNVNENEIDITKTTSISKPKTTGNWNLEQFFIHDKIWSKLIDSSNIEAHPQFSATGNAIIFTADYGDVYNIHKLNLKTKRITRLTNLVGGAQHPTLDANGTTIYYSGLGPTGYNIFKLKLGDTPLLTTQIKLSPPLTFKNKTPTRLAEKESVVELSSIITPYSSFDSIKPTWWFPHLLVKNDKTEIGLFSGGSDALRRHIYFLLAGYDVDNNWLIGDFNYVYDRWDPTVKIRAARLSNVFRDNNGNLHRIRFSDTLTAEFIFPLISFDKQWGLHTAAVIERDSDERIAAGVLPASTFTDSLAGIALTFNSTKRFPISISRNNGRRTKFVIESSDTFGGNFTGNIYTLNWQEYLPLGNQHVIALELTSGYGTKSPRQFRLGGTFSEEYANPLFQATDILFNRRKYALRGYPEGLPGLRGRRMVLGKAEWRFPIATIERGLMVPLPLGIHQLHGNIFYDLGEAWFNSTDRTSFRTATGFEITANIIFGYSIGFNIRFGFAHGLKSGGKNQTYLTVGSSF